jgi:hypothetical protein
MPLLSTKHQVKVMPLQKFKQALSKLNAKGYDAFFLALTSDLENQGIKIYVLPRKRQKLLDSASGINRRKQKNVKP